MENELTDCPDDDKAAILQVLRSKCSGADVKKATLIVIAVILIVVVIVLGLFKGFYKSTVDPTAAPAEVFRDSVVFYKSTVDPTAAPAEVTQPQAVCQDKVCLQATAWAKATMNDSLAPCDNFYQYACGNYRSLRSMSGKRDFISVLYELQHINQDKIISLLQIPHQDQDWASVKTLKTLFKACTDMPAREKVKGKPLVDMLTSRLGGWSVLGNWNQTSWDLISVLKVVQGDLWTDALWSYEIQPDPSNHSKSAVEIRPPQRYQFRPMWFLNVDPRKQKTPKDWKSYMLHVAQLLQRDFSVPMSDDFRTQKVKEFVDDVIAIETMVAKAATMWSSDPLSRLSVSELRNQTFDGVDVIDALSFPLGSAVFDPGFPVVVRGLPYFKNLTSTVSHLHPEHGPRMLHNYLVWRVLEKYAKQLSWDYVYAEDDVETSEQQQEQCFQWLSHAMPTALDSLFIMDRFADKNLEKVSDITETLKLALETSIANSSWMDNATMTVAISKGRKLKYKLGYPDISQNHEAVDAVYSSMAVNSSDHFSNVLTAETFLQKHFLQRLKDDQNRNEWQFPSFHTTVTTDSSRNEVSVPAGVLQFPLYDYSLPHSVTFGGLGSMVGFYLMQAVDEKGRYYDGDGKLVGNNGWWTETTQNAYDSVLQCMADLYPNTTTAPVIEGVQYQRNIRKNGVENLAAASGVRRAYEAFKVWEKQRGAGKKLNGPDLTNHQMFFLSYTQSMCSALDQGLPTTGVQKDYVDVETRVNMVLRQLEEFSTAFHCPAASPMNPALKCHLL